MYIERAGVDMHNSDSFKSTYPNAQDRLLFIHKYLEHKWLLYQDKRSKDMIPCNMLLEKLNELLPVGRFDCMLAVLQGFDVSESVCMIVC